MGSDGMDGVQAELLRHNENITYRVSSQGQEYVLRIHKPVDTMNLSLLRGGIAQKELIQGEMGHINGKAGKQAEGKGVERNV